MMHKEDFAIVPFNSTIIKDRYLVSNFMGGWDFLDKAEFRKLHSLRISPQSPFFNRLREKGLIVDEGNLKKALEDYRNLNANLFRDTSLHIAVLTTRCNLSCRYCQTKAVPQQDMNIEVVRRILKYLFDVKNPNVTLEFQGGEPLLNWRVLSILIEQARKFNAGAKKLQLALVSNLTLMDEEKMKFLVDFDVDICTSLDGPKEIHDRNRIFSTGKGSYDIVTAKVKKLKKLFGKKVSFLPTVTRYSLDHYREIIDEYVKWEQEEISLRPVNRLGIACGNWLSLGYSAEEFIAYYRKSLDYILSLNRKGIMIRERMARIMLDKILSKRDPGYVDLMNPCGMGRMTIAYMPDGDCYPCDEARMAGEEEFKLGNIMQEDYEDLMKKENFMHLLGSSLVNLWDYNSAFFPWLGTCPVLNYTTQNNIVPKISCSLMHKIYRFQFQYVFEKMAEDEGNVEIFKRWVKKGGE
jgi:His-Xaa-Ser system radical SAM maturase HxsB